MSDFNPHQFRDEMRANFRRRMRHRHRHSGAGGIILGTTILLVGVLFLLENFGLTHVDRAWQYWPAIVIAWGIASATSARHAGGRVWGSVIAAAGVILLLGNLHIISARIWGVVWPLFLIGVGLRMLVRAITWRKRREQMGFRAEPLPDAGPSGGPRPTEPGHLNEWVAFSGVNRRVDMQDFKGGEIFACFGGVELDLRSVTITQEEVVIEASALFGGVDLQVPETWNVVVEGHGLFGGYEDKTFRSSPQDGRPRVVITGTAIFGGVVVKN